MNDPQCEETKETKEEKQECLPEKEIKLEPVDEPLDDEYFEKHPPKLEPIDFNSEDVRPSHRRTDNRTCALCAVLLPKKCMKYMANDEEKLVLLSVLHDQFASIEKIHDFIRIKHQYVCLRHVSETDKKIDEYLCNSTAIEMLVMPIVNGIDPNLTSKDIIDFMLNFLVRNRKIEKPVKNRKRAHSEDVPLDVMTKLLPTKSSWQDTMLTINENPIEIIEVIWNGKSKTLPELAKCHRCEDSVMKFCVRKIRYKGEMREYPAYRCTQKGCQTFRNIKNIGD